MEHSNILVKGAVMATVVIIMLATLLSPAITDAAYNHVVQSNDGATDGLDLDYYATTLDGYPGCTIASNSDGTVAVAYPNTTKTVSGDAILIVGDGTISSFVKSGSLCFRQADGTVLEGVKSVTLGAAVNATVEATVIKSDNTSAVEPIEGAGWYLPTLGGAYGSYTGDIAYDLSDVVAVGYFAGAYIASKNGEVVSTNPYDLAATIERDADGNITGVKYAKATAEATAVDGSASAYAGEDPVILTPDDDDGTVAVLTPEEWDGEDAASTTSTPTGTLVGDLYYSTSGTSATVTGPADSTATSITIPATIVIDSTTYNVKTVGIRAFEGCTQLVTIALPAGITIGAYAFRNCTSLALTSLPEDIKKIEYNAFEGCTSLALTSLPPSINFSGSAIFKGCTSLALTSLPNWWAIPVSMFEGCTSLALTSLPTTLIGGIEQRAFYGCTSMEYLTIQSTTSIGSNALPSTLAEVLNLGGTTLTTAMGITDSTVVSDSIESLAIIQQKEADIYEEKGSEYTLLLIIPILVIVALLYAVISTYREKMQS